MTTEPTTLATVCFDGDSLHAIRDDGHVWVAVKRVCEALGIADQRQAQKLKAKPWACTTLMVAHDTSGREQQLFCVDLDSLPMWLATIEPSRVGEHVRPKLVRYQRECARVLRDHFLGRNPTPCDADMLALLTRVLDRLTALETRGSDPSITSQQHRHLRATVKHVAGLEVACGRWRNRAQASADLYRALRDECGWGGKGRPFCSLPGAQLPVAMAVLNCRRTDAGRILESREADRQTTLLLPLEPPSNRKVLASGAEGWR